ncbi:cytochrome b/b6 domain-containing protein [Burkholderia sp. Ac-20379]|uniref:cytochrome b/b6 domain-containing protein n=1 Tax=Burkholderia sp. Ac-20379 TaxID=2703900 RepID=UPI001982616B|nr:cytochrome b/b6 domain-containing protein [Burkholderia sp. Ac-20379]MBN3722710.1 cytochrome B [Burkholderia sp. Ac-20379]
MTLLSTRSEAPARSGRAAPAGAPRVRPSHPVWLRVTHWLNALAAVLMMLSGWRIYDASPVFPSIVIPSSWTIGGWLGGALQWHFAAMWLLMFNGLTYLALSVATGRFSARFLPLSPRAVLRDLAAALRGKLKHDDPSHYNAVQKFAYVGVIVDLIVLVLSGLAIWKSVQFPLLRDLFGGYDTARIVHFCAMAAMAAFVIVHVAMVALVPRSLLTMLRGR